MLPATHVLSKLLPDKAFFVLACLLLPAIHALRDFISSKWRLEREESKQEKEEEEKKSRREAGEKATTLNQGQDSAPLSK